MLIFDFSRRRSKFFNEHSVIFVFLSYKFRDDEKEDDNEEKYDDALLDMLGLMDLLKREIKEKTDGLENTRMMADKLKRLCWFVGMKKREEGDKKSKEKTISCLKLKTKF